MVSIKIKFKASAVPDKEGYLYFQVICNRVTRQIKTGYKLFPSEWNKQTGEVVSPPESSGRSNIVLSVKEALRWERVRLNKIVALLEAKAVGYMADDVVRLFHERAAEQSFFKFMEGVIERMRKNGKARTARAYQSALASFSLFRSGCDVMLDEIDSDLMMGYETWLKSRDVSMNTSSFYIRILRAVYNRALEDGLTGQRRPFRRVYTGVEKTVKRAVPIHFVKEMKDLQLPEGSLLDWARDMFLFSFYTRGMSFVDMAYLQKKDLKDGVLTYRRRKTGQLLTIRWESCMQQLVDKYPDDGGTYLLPIIGKKEDDRKQYESALHLANRKLKVISAQMGTYIRLTMYVARHTWASVARSKNIPMAVISEGMGHDSETTTRIYLASLDTSVVDKANELILSEL